MENRFEARLKQIQAERDDLIEKNQVRKYFLKVFFRKKTIFLLFKGKRREFDGSSARKRRTRTQSERSERSSTRLGPEICSNDRQSEIDANKLQQFNRKSQRTISM